MKYLENFAEPEIFNLPSLAFPKPYRHCLVIPAFNEDISFLGGLAPALNEDSLLIVVINQPPEHPEEINQALFEELTNASFSQSAALYLSHHPATTADILVVDRFRQPISKKEGVGLARKIGCDLALALISQGQLQSHWIHTSDCDTHLPSSYFEATDRIEGSAALYPFEHKALTEDAQESLAATQIYEQGLHHYVNHLKASGSPYGFHSLGSCIAVNASYYAKVRGFPKRPAGEDFYLLNKLVKLAPLCELTEPTLLINARRSLRTPFGTGKAVNQIMEEQQYHCYNPEIFTELKILIARINDMENYRGDYHRWLSSLPVSILSVLRTLNIEQLMQHLQKTPPQQAAKHTHLWFDGLKTLRFVHLLRDRYPDIPIKSY